MELLLPAFLPEEVSPFRGLSISSNFFGRGKGESEFVFSICKVRPARSKKSLYINIQTKHDKPIKQKEKDKKRAIPRGNLTFSLSHFFLTAHLAANMRLLTNEGAGDWILTLECHFDIITR